MTKAELATKFLNDPFTSQITTAGAKRCVEICEEYAQSLPTEGRGVRWVKASERLPDSSKVITLGKKSNGSLLLAFYVRTGEFDASDFDDHYDYIDENDKLIEGWYTEYDHFGEDFIVPAKGIIEWLDESPSAPEQREDAERIDKLETALDELIDAIPRQTEDMDWWDDNLTRAVSVAKKVLSEPFKR